jgi:lipopolysaccharide export system protein LptA
MTIRRAPTRIVAAASLAVCLGAAALNAQPQQQPPSGPPNALQGFSQNRDEPIKINSATLEVRDKDKIATFMGDVHLVQGDTTLRSKILVVHYEEDPEAKAAPPANGHTNNANGQTAATNRQAGSTKGQTSGTNGQTGGTNSQKIRLVEAKGDVIVVQKDQTATGENGVFDMRANTAVLLGNVVLSQGPNVVKGDRLTVDLTTGVSRVECGTAPGQCRVQALIQPNSVPKEGKSGEQPAGHEAAPANREAPRQRGPQSAGRN